MFIFFRFEQFCINYCNEKLQQLFIELVMKREQEEYTQEGISWAAVGYFDNKGICEMVDSPRTGIIAILDEQCARPNGSDKVRILCGCCGRAQPHALLPAAGLLPWLALSVAGLPCPSG